jgi:hypothetical protein
MRLSPLSVLAPADRRGATEMRPSRPRRWARPTGRAQSSMPVLRRRGGRAATAERRSPRDGVACTGCRASLRASDLAAATHKVDRQPVAVLLQYARTQEQRPNPAGALVLRDPPERNLLGTAIVVQDGTPDAPTGHLAVERNRVFLDAVKVGARRCVGTERPQPLG